MKAIILLGILAFGSIQLKTSLSLGDSAFISLIGLSVLSSFIVYFQGRLHKAGVTGIELHRAVEESRKTEAAVKELASAIIEVIAADARLQADDTSSSDRFKRALAELRRLSE